jgi:hypothetical protein
MRDNLLKEKHNGGLDGHFGHDKTFVQLRNLYYWSSMREEVKIFVNKCRICQYEKGRQKNTCLYQPLPIPKRLWDAINMDFVLELPRTKKGSDSIFFVVDRLSKMTHFIPCQKRSNATHIADFFSRELIRLHGLSRSILSDKDTKFIGHFWRILWKRLEMNLSFISTYNPHIDGLIGVVNRSLENLLRCLVTE